MSNVDHAEIAKFEALAHRWWDRESEFKPLHDINPLRVNWIDERVQLAGKKVLDVGCGSGWTTALLAHLVGPTGTVTGVEIIPEVLAAGRAHLAAAGMVPRVTVHEADPDVLGWPADAPYDRILVSADAARLPGELVGQLARDMGFAQVSSKS